MKKIVLLSLVLLAQWMHTQAQDLTTIAEARAKSGENIKVTGVVTTDAVMDPRLRYFQDATGGMVVFDPSNTVLTSLAIGDSIVVSGPLIEYRGLLEISGEGIVIELISSNNEATEPIDALVADMKESNEAELFMFTDVTFEKAGQIFGSGNFVFFDKNGNAGEMRLGSNSHPLVGKDIPSGKATLIGVLSQFDNLYQLLPRFEEDLIVGFAISEFSQDEIQTRSTSFSWQTNKRGTTGFRYRPVEMEDFDTIQVAGNRNLHEVTIGSLKPSSFYEVQAFSYSADDTTASPLQVVSTRSESNGWVKTYFNQTLDQISFSNYHLPNAFADTLAAYIDRATTSVDVAVYNANAGSAKIMTALNNAQARGVRVRYITDAEQANTGLANLNLSIPVLKDNGSGIMHNKFMVIDPGSRNHSYVLTASSNWTTNGLNDDPNNLAIIQDQAVTKAYLMEFEEMWGGSDAQPDLANAAFGPAKTKNTPSRFMVNDQLLEVYFSPSDGTTNAILETLANVNSDLRFSLLLLTRQDISVQISTLHENGWSVKGILDDAAEPATGNQYPFLLEDGVDVQVWKSKKTSQFHHKYAVVDALDSGTDPSVMTGSHNWSAAAETVNDENMVIIHDRRIAQLFLSEFRARYFELTGTADDVLTGVGDGLASNYGLYPNPSNGKIFISGPLRGESAQVRIISSTGAEVQAYTVPSLNAATEVADLSTYPKGMYVIRLAIGPQQLTQKIIITH